MSGNKFLRPKGVVGLRIYTTDLEFGTNKISRVFAEVWQKVFSEYMREFKFMADLAQLGFTLEVNIDSIDFQWDGYNSSLPLFVKETISRIDSIREAPLESIFNQVKEQLLQEMKNFYL